MHFDECLGRRPRKGIRIIKTSASNITLEERRPVSGPDSYIPRILLNGALYDLQLDRFFQDLPLRGIRSRHSLRAYGYDILVWARFLFEARSKTLWQADRQDVLAYHRARRRQVAAERIAASSWNRAVACLDRLYRWGVEAGIITQAPFTHRSIWRRGYGGRGAQMVGRNDAYEPGARATDVTFITLADYRIFRDVGLRGLLPGGEQRPGARDRNGIRNALFADILVTTGLRLEEASFLFASDLTSLDRSDGETRHLWLDLPDSLTKGNRGRQILFPGRLLEQARNYVAVERAHALEKFRQRAKWKSIENPIFVTQDGLGSRLRTCDGVNLALDQLNPEERGRVIICDQTDTPVEPAVLWVTEVGIPLQPNSWEVIFARASARCRSLGFSIDVAPHRLRHTFAVHMLAMLIQNRLRDAALPAGSMEGYRQVLGDPLQQVQRLLGHASLATTYTYLNHIASRADTVDAAVEELLALLPSEGKI